MVRPRQGDHLLALDDEAEFFRHMEQKRVMTRGHRCGRFILALVVAGLVAPSGTRAETEAARQPAHFASVAAEEGITFRHTKGDTEEKLLPETYGSGVAFADLDGDGGLDLYFVNSGSLTAGRGQAMNGLFLNAGDSAEQRFVDVSVTAGAPGAGYGMGVLAGDYDGDGDTDLFTTELGSDRLYTNDGSAGFADVTTDMGLDGTAWGTSATYVDIDQDGDLDLFVVDYVQFDPASNPWCGRADLGLRFYCDPRQFSPTVDRLYVNEADGQASGKFREVGARRGISRAGNGLGTVAGDFDDDGDADLYVANDMTANFLYHNDGAGFFQEGGLLLGTALSADGAAQAGMGVDAGDYDGDGDADLVVTNYQLEHNALYRNEGAWWSEVSFPTGLGEASLNFLGFGVGFFDFDNDGWLDLSVVNGHVHDNIEAYDPIVTHAQRAQVFGNVNGVFVEVSAQPGTGLVALGVGRGSAQGDYDGDGDVDIAINNNGGSATLLRNETTTGNWLRLSLVGQGANRMAIGARVRVQHDGGRTTTRWVAAGSGYLSTSETIIHLGLGAATSADVQIRWPDGFEQELADVQHGQVLVVRQSSRQ